MKIQQLIDHCKGKMAKGSGDFAIYRAMTDLLLAVQRFDLVPEEVPTSVYQQFVEEYFQFRRNRGANPKMNPAAGKALKEIINYFLKNKKVNQDPQKALEAWQYILQNWDKLSDFIKGQVGLTQINKHIEEIIEQLTHASTKAKQRHSQSERDRLKQSLKGQ